MYQVTVNFHGVCVHFMGVVQDVPHRVVLPDAKAFRQGEVTIHEAGSGRYFLMPHFAILRMAGQTVNIDGVIEKGNIVAGVHLQIANPMPGLPSIAGPIPGVPSLQQFVEAYEPSPEVVTGGAAMVYFDLFDGKPVVTPMPDGAISVSVTIATTAPPELRVTLLADPSTSWTVPIADQLWVANQGSDCDTPENSLDFLLHYLTAKSGIPERFVAKPPGVVQVHSFSAANLADALRQLVELDFPHDFNPPCFQPPAIITKSLRRPEPILVTSSACSNSQFP